jgi:hypothetical protein
MRPRNRCRGLPCRGFGHRGVCHLCHPHATPARSDKKAAASTGFETAQILLAQRDVAKHCWNVARTRRDLVTTSYKARKFCPVCVALLLCTFSCGESKRNTTDGAQSSDEPSDQCPEGYPYCAALDACLLPGRTCPNEGAGGAGAAGMSDGGRPALPELPQETTPGQIRCGGAMCESYTEYCCSGAGGNGNGSGFESCSSSSCPLRRECDETADCVGTEVCCFSVVASPPPVLASSCEEPEQCAFDGYWIGCGSQADCDAIGAPGCVAQPCGDQTIQTCGPITRSACKQ